jgi:putative DNA methylase
MTQPPNTQRKLIEVGLPLEEINAACKADKERKTGTLRNIHKWFAPMPLPAWRALLFAALIDDPEDEERRLYYLDVIRRLVKNGADLPDHTDLREAQLILQAQFPDGVPTVMDPFCGGGSTLIEGQRLGLPTYGSDLNPVPILISRTLTETLPKVWCQQPINPEPATHGNVKRGARRSAGTQSMFAETSAPRVYTGYEGLIRDVTFYAEQIRDAVAASTAQHFPTTPGENPIAWLWARTAPCPNPACRAETILTTSWWLSKKKGDLAWIAPVPVGNTIELQVRTNQRHGTAPAEPKAGRGDFACICCGTTLKADYLRREGQAGRLGVRMTAMAVMRDGQRTYRTPRPEETDAALGCPRPEGFADVVLNGWARKNVPLYGMETVADLYTNRQLYVLAAFADEIAAAHSRIIKDGGTSEWADAVSALLALILGKAAQGASTQSRWFIDSRSGGGKSLPAFGRNDLPMTWDFAEANLLATGGAGSFTTALVIGISALTYAVGGDAIGHVYRKDARTSASPGSLVATDPPYFDAIGYADLSDYFYIWHRRALAGVFPDLYTSMATPKHGELTAIPAHHGGSPDAAKSYFIDGFTQAFGNLKESMRQGLPCIVVYASKEQKDSGSEQTRWASILTAMISSGLEITGTWPIHGSDQNKMIGQGTNSVATYIAMVARPRPPESQPASWADFARELRAELPKAIHDLQVSAVLPVDVPQAVLGPGMRIFSRHPAVLRGDGSPVSVDDAIAEINRVREEVMDAAEGELDRDSQCALAFWSRHGWADATFDDANSVVRSRGRSVEDLLRATVLSAEQGRARVLGAPGSVDRSWDPTADPLPTAWEGVHHVADRLAASDLGVPGTATLYGQLQRAAIADATRALAYRLAALSAKLGRNADEQRYNDVIEAWPLLATASMEPTTDGLF